MNADQPLVWESVTDFGDNRYRADGVADPYVVYEREQWFYSRPPHVLLGELDASAPTLSEAQSICQDDHNKQLRLCAWWNYLLTHEPGT